MLTVIALRNAQAFKVLLLKMLRHHHDLSYVASVVSRFSPKIVPFESHLLAVCCACLR